MMERFADRGSEASRGTVPDSETTLDVQNDLVVGAALPDERAVEAPKADVRFGLVLYGGVSLAIYIYGVIFEFWRLVKASEDRERNAWSDLLEAANVTASVDIISGTSAGGVNGVLLAKVLAFGGDLDKVRKIWVDDADLSELLQPQEESSPRSLLSTQLFEKLLKSGLEDLDPPLEDRAPLASVLDLFISGTRLRPWERQFRTDMGGTIRTRQYRKVFRLKLRTARYNPQDTKLGYDRNDFVAENNRQLAQVARATSAFPAAFEPQLIDKDGRVNEFLFEDGEPESAYFSDGGILHNKPFTETLDAIFGRAADTPVERWLVSVEPDPEARAPTAQGEPEVDEVVSKSVFGIPRYQSIAGDLERLETHRRYATRQADMLVEVERQLADRIQVDSEGVDSIEETRLGVLGVHLSERSAQLCADLAQEIAQAATLSEAGERTVEEGLQRAVGGDILSVGSDFAFERRRIYFLLKRLSSRLAGDSPTSAELRPLAQRLWAEFDRISDLLWEVLNHGEAAVRIDRMRSLDRATLHSATLELASLLACPLEETLGTVRENTNAVCEQIDTVQPRVEERDVGQSVPFTVAWKHYELWDMFLLPVDPELGVTRDQIKLARISPYDTSFIDKPPRDKLAGDSLAHFGGFLKKEWRKNDILWGRLDAAEQIVGMIGAELSEPERRTHIEAVQREIVRKELRSVPEDYRKYLEDDYCVGSETLANVNSRKIATLTVNSGGVARNMLSGLEKARRRRKILHQIYRWVGKVLGWVLAAVRWPVSAIWGEEQPAIRAGSIAVLAVSAWGVLTAVLAFFGKVDLDVTLGILVGASIVVFIVWTVVMARVHDIRLRKWRRKRAAQGSEAAASNPPDSESPG